MKKHWLSLVAVMLITSMLKAQNIFPSTGSAGIGTTTPNSSSALDITSTTKGMLVSRMTKTQRDAIVSPATGLLIYQTNNAPGFYYYNGTAWTAISGKGANASLSNLVTTSINQNLLPGASNTYDLGSSSSGWNNGYFTGSIYLDGAKFIDNTGTGNTWIGNIGNSTNTGSYNTVVGDGALKANTTGFSNVAIGISALLTNTTGHNQIAIGDSALFNSSGIGNIANTAIGSKALFTNNGGVYNTACGYQTLYSNTTGEDNVAFGATALSDNTEGVENTALGASALFLNTIGSYNTATGPFALSSNTTGSYNTATGRSALYSNSTGQKNTANGFGALAYNIAGSYNTASGNNALSSNTNGNFNAAHGYNALNKNTSGNENTGVGNNALYSNTTGYSNAAAGNEALFNNTTAHNLVAVGDSALYNSTGSNNCALGSKALYSNTTGSSNSASGYQSLFSTTTGFNNTASGFQSSYSNTTGSSNTAVGFSPLFTATTGSNNTAVGRYALYSITTQSQNTAIGRSAGDNFTSDNGTFVGYTAIANANGYTNCMALGYNASVTASNKAVIGNSSVTSIGGFANWSNFSDGRYKRNVKENVKGLEFIMKLRPVTYTLDVSGIDAWLHKDLKMHEGSAYQPSDGDKQGMEQKEKIIYSGFIAQEVESAAKSIGYDFSGVDAPKNDKDLYGLRYGDFVVPLVKAVQELDQENGKLKTDLSRFSRENGELKEQITKLNEAVFGSKMNSGSVEIKSEISNATCPDLLGKSEIILGQNIPNPFDNSTLIPFRIPKNCHDASIMITNTSSSEVVSVIPVLCNEDHLSIDAGTLSSGMYSYTLYVDGKMIDTKQMIIAK